MTLRTLSMCRSICLYGCGLAVSVPTAPALIQTKGLVMAR